MQRKLLEILRCPVTRSKLTIKIIKESTRSFGEGKAIVIEEAILFAEQDWFYPVINGIPRLCVEAFLDYPVFLTANLPGYCNRKEHLQIKYAGLLLYVVKKINAPTKVLPKSGRYMIMKKIKHGTPATRQCWSGF